MHSLARWVLGEASPLPVALRGSEAIGRDVFLADVAALAGAIEACDASGAARERWVLCAESSYACAVGLLGLWQTGSIAVLPPNLEAGSLREWSRGVRGFVSDRPVESTEGKLVVPVLGSARARAVAWRELDAGATALELCTSGSTGARKVVPKTVRQLDVEIGELEALFGGECGDARVVSTVAHQHIYGLFFRVLWPLCAGRVFVDPLARDADDIARSMESLGSVLLVSSPAHLKRLPEIIDLARLRGRCRQIFSSGGPIDVATARRYERELGWTPTEVLGSTETGGIAWRRQGALCDSLWTPFANVEVEARDGLLHVRSPQAASHAGVATGVATGIATGVATGDRIEMHGRRFLLLGRADRIVKLFDERVSLDELEARLCSHPLVSEARALVIERNATPRTAVAVVLSEAGERVLAADGRSGLIDALRAHLRDHFRATAIPRSWRFVESLPRDPQGKTTHVALEPLFAKAPVGPTPASSEERASSRAAVLVAITVQSESELEVELAVPDDLWCLPGHFEGLPVVPGVVQLGWVLDWVASWLGREPELCEIQALKFQRMLTSGVRFRLRLKRAVDPGKIGFRLWNETGEFSTGRLVLAAGGG